jgi:hypothetical protein
MASGVTATSVCGGNTMVAWAAKDDPKGTKDDPAFQACLSQCKFLTISNRRSRLSQKPLLLCVSYILLDFASLSFGCRYVRMYQTQR